MKIAKFHLQIIACLALLCCINGVGNSTLAQNAFRLYTTSNHQKCDVYINGFPFKEMEITNTVSVSTILDPFLVKGTNTFLLYTYDEQSVLGASPSNAVIIRLDYGPTEPEQRQFLFNLTRQAFLSLGILQEDVDYDGGDRFRFGLRNQLTNSFSLMEIRPDGREFHCQYTSNSAMNRLTIPLVLDAPKLTSLPWQAPAVALTDGDRAEIITLVQTIHANLKNRNATNLLNLLKQKTQRVATAMGTTAAEEENKAKQFYDTWFSSAAFSLDELNALQLQIKTYADANVVQVLANNSFPIQGKGDGFIFKMPIYVSKISGKWWIVE